MTTVELEDRKAQLIRSILNDVDSDELIDKMQQYLKKIRRQTRPCQFSVEELEAELHQAIEDADNGLGCSQEEMRKKHP